MATLASSAVVKIGETAGAVWKTLDSRGPMPLTQLLKQIDAPRDTIMQAIGWLAREDKIVIEENGRTRTIGLV